MSLAWSLPVPTVEERHYGRPMRCFAERPRSLHALFAAAVARAPQRMAVVGERGRATWAELDADVGRVAGQLQRRGVIRGSRVAMLLGNGRPFLWTLWACARLGAIAVPLGTRLKGMEIAHAINDSGAEVLVFDAELAGNLPRPYETPMLRHRFADGEPAPGARPFEDLLAPVAAPVPAAVSEDDPAVILYTSGTTGRPKGAMLTGLGIVHSALHYQYCLGLAEGERVLLAVPASHVTGLVAVLAVSTRLAGTLILMKRFQARSFLDLAQRDRMTFTVLVPAMANLCLLEPSFARTDLSSWRVCGYGGAPMPEATIAGLARRLPGLRLANLYGATETTSPTTIMPDGGTALRPDSVGLPVPLGEVRVVDEAGREVPPGIAGELWIAGPMVVPGYWDAAEATRANFAGRFWKSGDLGTVDPDGFVRVLDRKKDMINRAGYKIYSAEVENALAHLPGVVESAVVGRPCPVLGERVHVFVLADRPEIDAERVRAFCAERLADYKVPETVSFVREPLPRNANGKVVKTELRRLLAERQPA
ncbi:class I adenylate-forming enzyme family protein [Stella sp.]|uniref:class I adenylate-forming enzyme family protein n=1 Tax=Stella sp. TaxID=2912054 RepID=UPI0035B27F95